MTFKEQILKLKENWLLVLILVIVCGVFLFSGNNRSFQGYAESAGYGIEMAKGGAPMYDSDFAPEVEERQITKNAWLRTEVSRGDFQSSEAEIKTIVKSLNGFLLNENANKYNSGRNGYHSGSYQIKVETSKYALALEQLKEIGEVQSFSENAQDITGRYVDLQDEIKAEKARLQRLQNMYSQADLIADKISLSNKIFDVERRIASLEDSLENMDKKVDYSTINFNMQEERSGYANIVVVKFSELVRGIVSSFNSLLSLVFWAIPWAIGLLIIWGIVRVVKKRV